MNKILQKKYKDTSGYGGIIHKYLVFAKKNLTYQTAYKLAKIHNDILFSLSYQRDQLE